MKSIKTAGVATVLAGALILLTGCPAADDREAEPVGEEIRVEITGDDRMRFSISEFEVHARQPVTVYFENVGTMPKESMGHNFVILQHDLDPIEFANASAMQVRNEYVAPEMEDRVIVATRVLGPGESVEVSFTAPSRPGEYPFVCSFPGHTQAGMRGIMTVREAP